MKIVPICDVFYKKLSMNLSVCFMVKKTGESIYNVEFLAKLTFNSKPYLYSLLKVFKRVPYSCQTFEINAIRM